MLYLVHADLSMEVLAAATTAELEADELVCRDEAGAVVARFPKLEILLYAHNESALQALQAALDEQRNSGGASTP